MKHTIEEYKMSNNQNYEGLANAVIVKGVDDYRKVLKALKQNPNNALANYGRREIEEFFRSEYFSVLTTVNPEMLIEK